jgi:GAF domain-containing protein
VPDVEELVQPVKPVTGSIGRAKSSPGFTNSQRVSTEDLLADVFLRVVELDRIPTLEAAMDFVLELAMEKVPCDSGSVFLADGTTGDLTFITARGPRARQVLASNITIPAGTGIAGFCSAEGVSVAVNDVEKDPRFYAGVGEKVDYETKSLLCAPMMTHGRSFGCMQLINRKGSPQFQEHEVGVLAYLAHQAALYMNNKLLE